MTITLDIKPEIKNELARQAAANGRALEDHVAALLEEAISSPAAGIQSNSTPQRRPADMNLVEVCAMVRGLTEGIDFRRNPSTGRPVDLS